MKPGSAIINTASINADTPNPTLLAYATTKGAIQNFTAGLAQVGKLLIGLYIGKQGLESTFGAAASLVVLLVWVYYSSQIVLLGAEFTRVYAMRRRPSSSLAAVAEADGPPEDARSTAPIPAMAQQSPYGLLAAAMVVGWVLAHIGPERPAGLDKRDEGQDSAARRRVFV